MRTLALIAGCLAATSAVAEAGGTAAHTVTITLRAAGEADDSHGPTRLAAVSAASPAHLASDSAALDDLNSYLGSQDLKVTVTYVTGIHAFGRSAQFEGPDGSLSPSRQGATPGVIVITLTDDGV